ncbi:MAG: FeoB-associated Cys-rich membrane protein [Clostridiales bacterium]|nr:FeoB-associated Cys-rich membrane protein [Clostridiales bacterium]
MDFLSILILILVVLWFIIAVKHIFKKQKNGCSCCNSCSSCTSKKCCKKK